MDYEVMMNGNVKIGQYAPEIEAETTTYAAASEPEYRIVDGIFKEINPADYDLSLKAADSDYVAIGYKKNGIDHFAIGERKSTVIVAANDYEHDTLSGIEVKKNSSGKLYSIISGLQNNEYSHVFLLPGTYNEGTTIYIYSSMEIVGLGDTDAVKVVKLSSSSSNRHLFNATGTKADYIDVTLRDLSLDTVVYHAERAPRGAGRALHDDRLHLLDGIFPHSLHLYLRRAHGIWHHRCLDRDAV